LGYKKHLLNVQYRMHSSISLFPNKEFYEEQLSDAPSVREIGYHRRFLEGKMYASYSFINIAKGKEQKPGRGHGWKNMAEAAAVCKIIESLENGFFSLPPSSVELCVCESLVVLVSNKKTSFGYNNITLDIIFFSYRIFEVKGES